MKLSDLRKAKGITQIEMSELIGVSQQQVARYESGKSFPSPQVFKRICEVFDLGIEEAWGTVYGTSEDGDPGDV